jgi:hypothetical protein
MRSVYRASSWEAGGSVSFRHPALAYGAAEKSSSNTGNLSVLTALAVIVGLSMISGWSNNDMKKLDTL